MSAIVRSVFLFSLVSQSILLTDRMSLRPLSVQHGLPLYASPRYASRNSFCHDYPRRRSLPIQHGRPISYKELWQRPSLRRLFGVRVYYEALCPSPRKCFSLVAYYLLVCSPPFTDYFTEAVPVLGFNKVRRRVVEGREGVPISVAIGSLGSFAVAVLGGRFLRLVNSLTTLAFPGASLSCSTLIRPTRTTLVRRRRPSDLGKRVVSERSKLRCPSCYR